MYYPPSLNVSAHLKSSLFGACVEFIAIQDSIPATIRESISHIFVLANICLHFGVIIYTGYD